MREVHLYRCERCDVVICLSRDRGAKFYLDQCSACKEWTDYEKVLINPVYDMFGTFVRNCFAVESKNDEGSNRYDDRQANE